MPLLDLEGSERILDVGCGDGKITAEIAARVPRGTVVGVDSSRDMIDFALSHFGPGVRPNLRFEVADARRLPFTNEFNLVVSFNALHWVPEQDAALRSIRSAMKSDGRALLRLVPAGERKSLENVIEETRRSSRWSGYFRDFQDPYLHLTPEQYAAMAARNRLSVLRIHTEAKAWDFKSRSAFFAFSSVGFVEWTRRLPEAEYCPQVVSSCHRSVAGSLRRASCLDSNQRRQCTAQTRVAECGHIRPVQRLDEHGMAV